MTKVQYELMRPAEAVAARESKSLVYLPIGTLEWHGVQNPLGLDTLKAHALCVKAAEQGGGVVMPPIWFGEHREQLLMEANAKDRERIAEIMGLDASNFDPGSMGGKTMYEQAHFYNDLLFHAYHQMVSLGFKGIFVMYGHYPLVYNVQFTAPIFNREHDEKVFGCCEADLAKGLEEQLGGRVGDHAGRWETSVMMALKPELVDISQLPEGDDGELVGIMGEDPKQSSMDFGERAVKVIVEKMVEKGEWLLGRYGMR